MYNVLFSFELLSFLNSDDGVGEEGADEDVERGI